MNRREAVVALGTIFAGTIFGAHRMMAGLANSLAGGSGFSFSSDDLQLLDEIGETILPATADSGGAKAVHIAEFMQEIVRDFYMPQERTAFAEGLQQIQTRSGANHGGRTFVQLSGSEREAVLLELEHLKPRPEGYTMLKQLTVWGFFSSEIGATQARAHVPVPGRYEGCVTISPGTRAWAE
ncbi:MAG: gluconate 2-dehydrogenase subunit 3 family protein [Opitutus sp.]